MTRATSPRRRFVTAGLLLVLLPALALGDSGVGSSEGEDPSPAIIDATNLPPLPSSGEPERELTIPTGDFENPPSSTSPDESSMSVQSGSPPPEPTVLGPYDGATVKTITPTLYVNGVTDPDGDPVTYWFRLFTGTESAPARVHESGWISSTSWKLPGASLQDGQSYSWFVYVSDGSNTVQSSWTSTFDIDLRFSDGTGPEDGLGIASVELGSGNLSIGAGSPSYPTVGGSIGASYSFDSFAQDAGGLTGEYYKDVNANRVFDDDGGQLNRIDPEINFSWGAMSPSFEQLGLDNFLARWTGTLQVPTSGSWRFGASSSDGVRIWINNALHVDRWFNQSAVWPPTYGNPLSLTAGTSVPIKIEYYDATGDATIKLATRGPGVANDTIVPANWLRPDNTLMPEGWSFNPGTTHLRYSKARVNDNSVTLIAPSGQKYEFKRSGDIFTPPAKDEHALMTTDASTGNLVLQTDGMVYTFRSSGELESVTTASDDRTPASPEYIYSGSPVRLTAVRDRVSGRQMMVTYGGGSCPVAPAGFDASAPQGMPCRVSYWDGRETQLFYVAGRFARISDPGGEVTDFGYTNGKLTRIREPLASDAVAAGVRPNDDTTRTLFTYDSSNVRITSVQLPKPTPTALRPQHNYSYNFGTLFNPLNPDTADLDVVGTTGTSTFDRRIVLDDRGRVVKDIALDGTFATIEWDSKDRQLSSTDAAGRKATTIFDTLSRPTDHYGPAPATWFGGNRKPVSEHLAEVPHTQTRFDEGYTSLAATYWDNPYLAGPPKCRETGVGESSGAIDRDWGAGSPACLGTATDNWSARFTGLIKFPSEIGPHVFQTIADDGVRVWIDDKKVIDKWTSPGTNESLFVSYPTNSLQTIRIDFVDRTGNAKLKLSWKKYLDLLAPFVVVPGSNLFPNYGLPTSSTTDDAQAGALSVATTYAPERGLALATTKDPSGLALTTQTGYEAAGVGYNRRVSRTLPAGNSWSYEYYGATETLTSPPCGVAAGTPQAGFLKKRVAPDPDGAGSQTARLEELVYDAAGRQVGMRIGNGGWSCATFDARGRPATQSYPAFGGQFARTVTSNYAVDGDPLKASVSDPVGTIASAADLLGRTVSYTDVWQKTTTYTFDQAGRPTSSNGPAGLQEFTYSASTGRPSSQKLDGKTIATPSFNGSGELSSANYPSGAGNAGNGTSLASVGRDPIGRTTSLRWNQSNGSLLTQDDVTRSQSGRVVDQSVDGSDPRPGGQNFVYDATGRLTNAWVPGRTTTYSFAPSGGCGAMSTAGKNTNRTSMTIEGGSPITYCYDNADRLTQTSDERYPSIDYDERGNTTLLGNEQMVYDGADRHVQTTKGDSTVTYTRDATDRIVARTVTTPDDKALFRSSSTDVTPAPPTLPTVGFRSSSSASTAAAGSSSLTVSKPSGVIQGDLMLLHLSVDRDATLAVVAPPSGWALVSDASSPTVRSLVYRRGAGASEPASYQFSFTFAGQATSVQASAGIGAYTGVDTTFPIASAGAPKTAATAGSLTLDPVAGSKYGRLVAFFAFRAANVSPPTGMEERWDTTSAGPTPTTSEVADQPTATSGSTGSRTASSANTGAWAGQMLTLRAAPSPTAIVDFRSSATATTPLAGASTLSVSKPYEVAQDDFMLLHLSIDRDNSLAVVAAPAGWTQVSDATSTSARSLVYRKVATASEPESYQFSFSLVGQATCGWTRSGTPSLRAGFGRDRRLRRCRHDLPHREHRSTEDGSHRHLAHPRSGDGVAERSASRLLRVPRSGRLVAIGHGRTLGENVARTHARDLRGIRPAHGDERIHGFTDSLEREHRRLGRSDADPARSATDDRHPEQLAHSGQTGRCHGGRFHAAARRRRPRVVSGNSHATRRLVFGK
jgi:YD repeat-containing protein